MFEDFLAISVLITQLLLALFSIVFFVSGLDDLFIDLAYLVWKVRNRASNESQALLQEEQLTSAPEQPVAIMVPTWDESSVIRSMLANTLRTIRYRNYHIFVGTYPNDPATQSEVERIRAEFSNVHRIVCANPGPTCKADCLNWVYQGIRLFEKERGIEFSIFVIEDCEDLVHPLCLALFNHLIPANDMIQIPVFPLERPWSHFTSGHYLDEFAEYHGKDMFVRQALSGAIPSAGVGCAFSRRAMEMLADGQDDGLFDTGSLTEDYEFGLRVGMLGLRSTFLSQPMPFVRTRRGTWQVYGMPDRRIAVREYFPATFRTAVRQKSRWVIGIALQGWKNLGWKGGLAMRYMLYRDRKAILTNEVSLFSYFIVVLVVGLQAYSWLIPDAYHYPPLVEKGSWLWNLLIFNAVFLINRLGWRVYSVWKIYGWKQAVLAIPRQVWSNVVNGCATNRALYLYVRALVLRKKIVWDKTAHVLPLQLTIATYRRRIGDLLIERGLVSVEQLEEVLSVQKTFHAPLGFLLVSLGFLQDRDLIEILAAQLRVPWREIDLTRVPVELLEIVTRRHAIRFSVFPVEMRSSGELLLATAEPVEISELEELRAELGRQVQLCLATRADIAFAIRYGYERLGPRNGQDGNSEPQPSTVGNRGAYRRIGDILLDHRSITPESLKDATKRFTAVDGTHFGDFLVQEGYISRSDLEMAVNRQKALLLPEDERRYAVFAEGN